MGVREVMRERFRRAERFLIDYASLRADYELALEGFLSGGEKSLGGGGKVVSDPTGSLAVKRVQFERDCEDFAWLEAVRRVEACISERERFLLACRRRFERGRSGRRGRGRPPWAVFVVGCFASERDEVIGLSTVRSVWKNLVRMVAFEALGRVR